MRIHDCPSSLYLGGITEHRYQILMVDFKVAISEFRTEGASQADIDAMLDELEEAYASDDAAGKARNNRSERSGATASPQSLMPALARVAGLGFRLL